MSKAEILAELTRLSAEDLAEVQARLDEIVGETWHPNADLSTDDRSSLDIALTDYQKNPRAGSTWDEVKARIKLKLQG